MTMADEQNDTVRELDGLGDLGRGSCCTSSCAPRTWPDTRSPAAVMALS